MSDSCNCGKDLWKKPKETICFLICFNLTYLYLRHYQTELISLCLKLLFYTILFSIIMKKLDIPCCKEGNCCCSSSENPEEKIKKTEEYVLKGVNKINDIIEMKENADYNILYFCILMILFGETFSTLTVIVLCVDIFVILHYGNLKNQIKEYYNTYSKMIIDKVPKYKGD